MKKLLISSFLLMITLNTFAQNGESVIYRPLSIYPTPLEIYPNGYIYDESTMNKLTRIVDSLNTEYHNSGVYQTYYSKEQTVGHYIRLETGDIKAAKKDMDNRISFKKFKKKYPDAIIEENTLIVKSSRKNDDGQKIGFKQWGRGLNGYGFSIHDSTGLQQEFKKTWVYEYWAGGSYVGEAIRAFYFPDDFEFSSIPEKYAHMTGYTNFLVPMTTKYKKDARPGNDDVELRQGWKMLPIDQQRAILDTMRSIQVIGCGLSSGYLTNRETDFALIAAEVTDWEIFLPAHLSMVISRAKLVIGEKYTAGKERVTSIHELEALGINVTYLVLGMFLRNQGSMYYNYSPRIAWTFSELENKTDIVQTILDMITDKELDDYNRLLMYRLFDSYTAFIPDKAEQKMAYEKLDTAAKQLPKYSHQMVKKYIESRNNKY